MQVLINSLLLILFLSLPVYAKQEDSFWIEYIDVGQGDCALIQCDGHYMLIDGGPAKSSSIIYTILKQNQIDKIDLMIATHPDADHIGGLSGALNYATADTILSPVKEHDTKTFQSLLKYINKQNKSITYPVPGDRYYLGNAIIDILGPIYNDFEINNLSIIVKVSYGTTSFMFMGDAEIEEESDIVNYWDGLECDVLKIGHHGSKSSTSTKLLDATKPKYAVISVGKDNSYGHPTDMVLDRLNSYGIEYYRTDLQGDIFITSNGKEVSITTEKNNPIKKNKEDIDVDKIQKQKELISEDITYVVNTNSKKFHVPYCPSVDDMSQKNRQDVSVTRDELLSQGYKPCKRCNP